MLILQKNATPYLSNGTYLELSVDRFKEWKI